MEVELIFKIAAVGIIVTILNQVLVRSGREEQARAQRTEPSPLLSAAFSEIVAFLEKQSPVLW